MIEQVKFIQRCVVIKMTKRQDVSSQNIEHSNFSFNSRSSDELAIHFEQSPAHTWLHTSKAEATVIIMTIN